MGLRSCVTFPQTVSFALQRSSFISDVQIFLSFLDRHGNGIFQKAIELARKVHPGTVNIEIPQSSTELIKLLSWLMSALYILNLGVGLYNYISPHNTST